MNDMKKTELVQLFDRMIPDDTQKSRILRRIMSGTHKTPLKHYKRILTAVFAACLVCAIALVYLRLSPDSAISIAYAITAGNERETVTLADNIHTRDEYGVFVQNVSARPELDFFIDSENIAEIELTCKNEFLYVFVHASEIERSDGIYISYADPLLNLGHLFDKSIKITFDESFKDYFGIEYRWDAWRLESWASMDNWARVPGAGIYASQMSDEEKLGLAAGDKTGLGHIQLAGCPGYLQSDTITVKITDRNGSVLIRTININLSNNESGQLILTAVGE
jgi:hypothetical protein